MDRAQLQEMLPRCLREISLPEGIRVSRGKVRDIVDLDGELLIVTTDRLSAFDRVITTIPCKGEVLNTISLFWFSQTRDIVPNHILEQVSARTVRSAKCDVVPVEVVVRGCLTGSAWRDYEAGRDVSGIKLPKGMRANQRFDAPLLTPSTKEERGHHDMPISPERIVKDGIVPAKLWDQIAEISLALFARGTQMAAANGLILVDTKYEFGLRGGKLHLVDEVHTPDSSRYWYADGYEERFSRGEKQRELDKEYLRQWLLAKGWQGDGEAPAIPDEVRVETAFKYITAWQTITGDAFKPGSGDAGAECKALMAVIDRKA